MPVSKAHSNPIHYQRFTVIYTLVLVHCNRFDAWGRRRNPDDWSYDDVPTSHIFDRGYTGHQHLDEFGIINMLVRPKRSRGGNGRVYDPVLGRFLSPDNNIQAPGNPQNYNRYSYALNNPLVYTDPSGDVLFTAIATLVPGLQPLIPLAISMDIAAFQGAARADMNGGNVFEGYAKGALTGMVGGALGPIGGAGMSFGKNLAYGVAEGAAVGAFDAWIWGNDVGQGMLGGAIGGAVFTTLESDNFKNLLKGKGFYTNENVFNNFKAGKYVIPKGKTWQEQAIDYFGINVKYQPGVSNPLVEADYYYGYTNTENGNIYLGDGAFQSYGNFKGTYVKESYSHSKIISNEKLYTFNEVKSMKYYPEEAKGFAHAYFNQGLYPNASINWYGQANSYWSSVYPRDLLLKLPKPWYYRLTQIPRRW